MAENPRGKFVTLEGLEGSGKSTNAEYIKEYLLARDIEVLSAREPGGTFIGQKVRELLLYDQEEEIEALTELYLMFACRAQLLTTKIKPALQRGQWVICDRYVDSSFAYQGGGRGLGQDVVQNLQDALGSIYEKPDLTILLDIEPELVQSRIRQRGWKIGAAATLGDRRPSQNEGGGPDRFEREGDSFFDRIRKVYLDELEKSHIVKVDASKPIEIVQANLAKHLDNLIENASG